MRNECKCTNPNGGGMRCPAQNIAICIRGKDMECYGECVPIPYQFDNPSNSFNQWLSGEIRNVVEGYARTSLSKSVVTLRKMVEKDLPKGGNITFQLNKDITIYVQFVYIFSNDTRGGLLM